MKSWRYHEGAKLSITFEEVAIQAYGSADLAHIVRQANPQIIGNTVAEGEVIIVPERADPPEVEAPAEYPDEVAVIIAGKRFRFWTDVSITRTLDSIDTVDIKGPFDASVVDMRKTFVPFSYRPLAVTVGGVRLFTGTMVSVTPDVSESAKTITISGYARAGVLADANPPVSALPVEFNKQTLPDIAAKLCEPYGLRATFIADAGGPFERVACEPTQNILEFLTKLAQERGLIISNDTAGNLIFTRSESRPPVARLSQGSSPVMSVSVSFSPQNYFSHISGLEATEAGKTGGAYTVHNLHVLSQPRILNFDVTDADGPDLKTAVQAKAGRMMGNMASYTLEVAGWRTSDGKLWTPGDTVTLIAPDAMIYTEYPFLIRAVTLTRDADSLSATLELAMPGAFNGEIPETLPWE